MSRWNNDDKPFTLADGLAVQKKQMLFWQSILKTEKYEKLAKIIQLQNDKLNNDNTGYDVPRGTSIDNIVHNELRD